MQVCFFTSGWSQGRGEEQSLKVCYRCSRWMGMADVGRGGAPAARGRPWGGEAPALAVGGGRRGAAPVESSWAAAREDGRGGGRGWELPWRWLRRGRAGGRRRQQTLNREEPARGGSARGWWLPVEWLHDDGGAPCQTGARRRCSGVGRRRWWPGVVEWLLGRQRMVEGLP